MDVPLDEDGFLGHAAARAREQIRETCREYLDVAYAVNRLSQRTTFCVGDRRDGQRMTASGLLIKLQNDVQSVILLAERGLPEQAMSMLRIAFESLVRLRLVHEDSGFWKKYRDSHEIFRRKSLESLISGRTGAELTDEEKDTVRANLADVVRKIEREHIEPLPDIGELVVCVDRLEGKRLGFAIPKEGGSLSKAYCSLYQLGNQTTHSAPSSIHDYWTSDEEDFVTGFVHGPRTDGLDSILIAAMGVLLSALQVVQQLFEDVTPPPDAGKVIERFQEIKEGLASKSPSRG